MSNQSDLSTPNVVDVPDVDISSLWYIDGDQDSLDDAAAVAAGHVDSAGRVLPHGTWVNRRYYRLWVEAPDPTVSPPFLLIFDNDGEFAAFDWYGQTNSWQWAPRDFTRTIPAGTFKVAGVSYTIDKAYSISRTATLRLARSDGGLVVTSDPATDGVGQVIEYDDEHSTMSWFMESGASDALYFATCAPVARVPSGAAKEDSWGYVFRDSPIAKLDMMFEGYVPEKVPVATDDAVHGYLCSTGLSGQTRPGEGINGVLVFDYPAADSGNWIRQQGEMGQTPIPLGLRLNTQNTGFEATKTTMVSSTAERASSWSSSLGLSGGITGLLTVSAKGTYKEKLEEQQKSEHRFAQARKLTVSHDLVLDVPNLELDPALLAQIQLLAASAVQSKSPEWGQFIATYGTHYCHGMTQGTLRLSETEFSLAAEASAYENEVDIETEVKGDIEGVDLGTSASMSQSWSQKNVHEVSEEDITVFEVGEQGPMPVFLDLRPLTELFSPIFFPYRESNDWFKIAPAIWWDLRKSLGSAFIDRGVGADLDPALGLMTTPQHVHVKVVGWGFDEKGQGLPAPELPKAPTNLPPGVEAQGIEFSTHVHLELECTGRAPLDSAASEADKEAWAAATAGAEPGFVNLTTSKNDQMVDGWLFKDFQLQQVDFERAAVDVAVKPSLIVPIAGAAKLNIQLSGRFATVFGPGNDGDESKPGGKVVDFSTTGAIPIDGTPTDIRFEASPGVTCTFTLQAVTVGGLQAGA
jgi:hypothetical protein